MLSIHRLFLVALVSALFAYTARAAKIYHDLHEVKNKTWDFIVVGGGLGGLTVSKRLSEHDWNVLVIEAGNDDRKDPRVYDVNKYGVFEGSELDWNFETIEQGVIGNSTKKIRAGKTLGGSTSINGAAWNRAHKVQYDMLANITGDPTFGFHHMQKYMNRAESFKPPNNEEKKLGMDYVQQAHGYNGFLEISPPPIKEGKKDKRMYTGPEQGAFLESIKKALGVAQVKDQNSGNNTGVGYTYTSISSNHERQSACKYLEKAGDNVAVLVGWRGVRLLWDSEKQGVVNGVVVQKSKGAKEHTVHTRGEVILAAGAINTPGILERSGVGAKDVLKKAGIKQIVNLPGVGKNLQEQTMNTMGGKANVDYSGGGPANMIANTGAKHLFSNVTKVNDKIHRDLFVWSAVMESGGYSADAHALSHHYLWATEALFKKGVPLCEHFFDIGYPADSYGIDTWCFMPYSRGKVHIKSTDAFENPELDPNYFAFYIDMDMQVAAMRANRRILQTSPLKDLLNDGETQPGLAHIPNDKHYGAYNKWQAWILGTDGMGGFISVAHQIGTCSMMPKKHGGVVDTKFKVYGTKNVRIVDGSVLPIQISAHLSSTLYGFAEKGAEEILLHNKMGSFKSN